MKTFLFLLFAPFYFTWGHNIDACDLCKNVVSLLREEVKAKGERNFIPREVRDNVVNGIKQYGIYISHEETEQLADRILDEAVYDRKFLADLKKPIPSRYRLELTDNNICAEQFSQNYCHKYANV
ncbi:hypothetical protein OESDEN_07282 [Oesophagostomum dentatum]|uniref:Saposin B-type domain-containing protein n=1 Tax=Oesophagostomum dentatum TaxID=61180 RepID=A0A0B1T9J7_OESDE|nr:hypothetical protein OESDEN_07282 [Oesophagostomum dentatum]